MVNFAIAQSTSWDVKDMDVSVQNGEIVFSINQLTVADYLLENIHYRCPDTFQIYPKHKCKNALINATLNNQDFQMNLDTTFNVTDDYWAIKLSSINNQISLTTHALTDEVAVSLKDIVVNDFFKKSSTWLRDLSGTLSGELQADTSKLTLKSSDRLEFNHFSYEQSDDVVFFELGGDLSFTADVANQKMTAQIEINTGEMLFNELYVDFNNFPVTLEIMAFLNEDFEYVLESKITNQQSMQLQTEIKLNQQLEWDISKVKIKVLDSHYFNQQILGSMLGIYGFGQTQMSGGFELLLNLDQGKIQYGQIQFDDFYALNNKRKLQIDALKGMIFWDWKQQSKDSHLNWQNLLLAGMPVNAGQAHFNLSQNQFKLLGEHAFSVFDGAIIVKELTADELFMPSISMTMNASILPISLKLITEKMNWPTMSGTISGELPGMVKQDNVISFLGALRLSVFEGEMSVENLSLERLFGVAPVIAADVSFERFDLALLTETFGFGQITGKLSGNIEDLRITNWKTDRMNAHVYTVKTKGIKQSISQRAIDNISSLGGIKGAISKTFLRFFDDFTYQRIELSCKLHNSVCKIGGMKNQDNQFVIVEGGGIPKINIVGFVRTIDWEEFISRLLNANYDN